VKMKPNVDNYSQVVLVSNSPKCTCKDCTIYPSGICDEFPSNGVTDPHYTMILMLSKSMYAFKIY